MTLGAYAAQSAITQERTIKAAKKLAEILGVSAEFPMLRVNGDLNQIKVSALNQRKAVADFVEAVVAALEKPVVKPQEKARAGKG